MKLFASIFVCLLVLVMASCSHDSNQPGYQINMLTDMVQPVPYESYSKNEVFADGLTMQNPVAGTVYRGSLVKNPFLENPVTLNKNDLERGKFVYENYCQMCHGLTGEGDGSLIPKYPNPTSYHSKKLMEMLPEQMFQSISHGMRDMPAHAGQLEELDRWRVIYYVRSLQGRNP